MNNEMDKDFEDINKESKNKMYIIVGILYFFVIVFSVLLFFGVKNQNDIIKEKIDEKNNKDVNTKSDLQEKEDKNNINNNNSMNSSDKNNSNNDTSISNNDKNNSTNKKNDDLDNILNQI